MLNISCKSLFYFFGSILLILTAACSKNTIPTRTADNIVVFPAPPDTPRIQFLTKFTKSSDLQQKRSSLTKFVLGDEKEKEISKPYGMAIYNGVMYICDTGNKCLDIIDLNKQTFEFYYPEGKGQLRLPVNCFIDDDGYLYVVDAERKQVVVFDNNRSYIDSFGEKENFKPSDVFVYGNEIFVSNITNNQICVYSKANFQLQRTFPDLAKGDDGYIYSATNLSVVNDAIYVSDFGDFKIKKYSLDGKFISALGSYGRQIGQFVRPKGIAVDKESNLYVVDAGFENVQIFNKDNKVLMYFGGSYKKPGNMWLPAKVIIDYKNLKYFKKYVDDSFNLKYLILVSNQYGPDKISVYGFVEPKK